MCLASNHQNLYRNGPRAHFPFNHVVSFHIIKPFLCICILASTLHFTFWYLLFVCFSYVVITKKGKIVRTMDPDPFDYWILVFDEQHNYLD
jgi:hypothetical protein